MEELDEKVDEFEDEIDLEDGDINLREALEEVGWETPEGGPEEAAEFVQFEWGNSAPIEESSYIRNYELEKTEEDYGGDDYLVVDERGFDSVIDYLLGEIDEANVLTEHKVTDINRSEEMVTVVTDQGEFTA